MTKHRTPEVTLARSEPSRSKYTAIQPSPGSEESDEPAQYEYNKFTESVTKIMNSDPLDRYTHGDIFDFHAPFWGPKGLSR